jgi:hypothetical protein
MINLMSENTLKQIIGSIVCCTGLAFGVVNAEDAAPAAGTPTEDPSLWDKTKETSGEAWDTTKEGSAKAWDATKEGSKKAWGATKEAFTDPDTPEEAPAADNPQQ